METIDFALYYANRGWQVFPCKPGDKVPATKWADDATCEDVIIRKWWTNQPLANIGIATGARSGLVVLDIDAGHGGEETLLTLTKKYGILPQTPVSKTGGGGRHFFFAHPGVEIRNTAGKLGVGIDSRGDGGYVVAPPSKHPSGDLYTWASAPSKVSLAPCPSWMVELLTATDQPIAQPTNGHAYAVGERHTILTSLAGTMRRRGMGEEAIFSALMKENEAKCLPPMKEIDVRLIASSMARYAPSAAPQTLDRNRLHIEWAFAKSVFDVPALLIDFQSVKLEAFSDTKVRKFWELLTGGKNTTEAANEAGILKELEEYTCDPDRIDSYAEQLVKYTHLDSVISVARRMEKAAESGDVPSIEMLIGDANSISFDKEDRVVSVSSVADEVEADARRRAENPSDVCGIPYAWPYLSLLTMGKQPGEIIILAGEPKAGKSWWVTQDALATAQGGTPVYLWSGEMRRKQIVRRLYSLLGVDSRRMKTGYMRPEDWDTMSRAKVTLSETPLHIDDAPMSLSDLRGVLTKAKSEYGIEQFIIDYSLRICNAGNNEIERTANVSGELKAICNDLDLAGILIVSVNKLGMDSMSETVSKSNVRGSGQQIHDADIVYILTKFAIQKDSDDDLLIMPDRYDKIVSLHIAAGRELDHRLPGGVIHYERIGDTPCFKELKEIRKDNTPTWTREYDVRTPYPND